MRFRFVPVALLGIAAVAMPARCAALDWLSALPADRVSPPAGPPVDGAPRYLRFGDHLFAPAGFQATGDAMLVAPFQQLWIVPGVVPARTTTTSVRRDAFWDTVIVANPAAIVAPRYALREAGSFGEALPAAVRSIDLSAEALRREEASLADPVLPANDEAEPDWNSLAARAWPLDFQKVLVASPHDSSPAFAYQNGQWITTWDGAAPLVGCREDHWFAPALLVGDQLVRPAPLSARTQFRVTDDGTTLPLWTLEWREGRATVRQRLFSQRAADGTASVQVELELAGGEPGARLVLGVGRRPSSHFWDENKDGGARSPVPWFSVEPGYVQVGRELRDRDGRLVLQSSQPFRLEALGPVEALLVFEADARGRVQLATPQIGMEAARTEMPLEPLAAIEQRFVREARARLAAGAQVRVPDPEWQQRIDSWRNQVDAITRVTYGGRERLAYGAYFYQDYFGIEEGWPPVALAFWGRGDEAKRQAAIMLEPENLDKANVHHQSRNGAAPTVAATVALLTGDAHWLATVAPAMTACARWTDAVREPAADSRPDLLRGLLPAHIYGGDVRDPATSLYATTACWRGMQSTAEAFQSLGDERWRAEGVELAARADRLRARLQRAFDEVTLAGQPPFVPLALALPSLGGRNEGPYDRLTATRYGNYWNLFAPSFLELGFASSSRHGFPNRAIMDFAAERGGLWAGQPRFYAGLDGAYSIGYVGHRLEAAARDVGCRPQALASLEGFMLHAASRNGFTIPEVAGLFPYRLQRSAYERLVREAPWHFGMYDADRYLGGHISFTEPLGAAAGAALIMVRQALLQETRDDRGTPDGGLVILPAVPAAWLAEGKEIVLRDMPTFYGQLSAVIRSRIESAGEVAMEYQFTPGPGRDLAALKFRLRIAAPGHPPREIEFAPKAVDSMRVRF